MTTRLDLRMALRRKLEDTGVTPLWDDLLLNEALWNSLVRFGVRVPLEASVSVAIPAGATTVSVAPVLPRERVLRVFDANGEPIREVVSVGRSAAGEAIGWRWWNGALILSRALGTAETWTIEYRATRSMPADDISPVQIQPEDEPIVVAMAAEVVLRRRAVEELKRNGVAGAALAVADAMMREADRLIADRRRSVRSGVLAEAV